ncbi:MAG: carboxypeptidase-like regulatory domain-containing protein [Candidatus Wallbacteria bacterium]|nr:carboxypeptidase-like regulatory domain-containing protein [Candidatus Wallbacteria bacterium]
MKTAESLLLIFILAFSATIRAAEIRGTVINDSNRPVPDIQIRIGAALCFTDKNGDYRLTALPVGTLALEAEKNGQTMARTVSITEGINRYSFIFMPEPVEFSGQSAIKDCAMLNIYGLSGGIEVFDSGVLQDDHRFFLLYSRIDKKFDYSYDAFHFHAWFKVEDNFDLSLTLVNSSRISQWFGNHRTVKSLNFKFSPEEIPVAIGGSASDAGSYLFLAHDISLTPDETLSLNLNSRTGNLRTAALNIGYTRRFERFSLTAEGIMKDYRYETFNLGFGVPYRGYDYSAYYHRDNDLDL